MFPPVARSEDIYSHNVDSETQILTRSNLSAGPTLVRLRKQAITTS